MSYLQNTNTTKKELNESVKKGEKLSLNYRTIFKKKKSSEL